MTYSCGTLHMDMQRQGDQLEPTYCSSVLIRDVALKTSRKRWTIEKGGEKASGMTCWWHDIMMIRTWKYLEILQIKFIRWFRYSLRLLYIDRRPGQTCHSKVMLRKEVTHSDGSYEKKSRRWTWLTIWDKVKSHGTLIDWFTRREWPVNCMTVISA